MHPEAEVRRKAGGNRLRQLEITASRVRMTGVGWIGTFADPKHLHGVVVSLGRTIQLKIGYIREVGVQDLLSGSAGN